MGSSQNLLSLDGAELCPVGTLQAVQSATEGLTGKDNTLEGNKGNKRDKTGEDRAGDKKEKEQNHTTGGTTTANAVSGEPGQPRPNSLRRPNTPPSVEGFANNTNENCDNKKRNTKR